MEKDSGVNISRHDRKESDNTENNKDGIYVHDNREWSNVESTSEEKAESFECLEVDRWVSHLFGVWITKNPGDETRDIPSFTYIISN